MMQSKKSKRTKLTRSPIAVTPSPSPDARTPGSSPKDIRSTRLRLVDKSQVTQKSLIQSSRSRTATSTSVSPSLISSRRAKQSNQLGRQLTIDADRVANEFVTHTLGKGVEGLKEEFEDLGRNVPEASRIRAFKANADKNRFKDVVCLDATRIVLRLNVPPDTNYIHANRVEMADVDKVFIATQAPLMETMSDFWRMCFQEAVATIVMLCSFGEARGRKCIPYFPMKENTVEKYGCMVVKCLKIGTMGTIATYDLEVAYPVAGLHAGRKQLKLHRMDDWPDSGVPHSGRSIINILRSVDKDQPCVIHCAAGIGRTGAAIAIEAGIQRLTKGKEANILAIVEELRCKRAHSVQTELQYVFIYFALLEYIRHKQPKYADRIASFRHAFKKEVADLERG